MIISGPHLGLTALAGGLAGLFGGLAGVGGSMVILPALHFTFGEETENIHHVYMAAAMAVNVAVSIPAAMRHRRAGAVRNDLLPALLVSTAAAMIVGVLVGNLVKGDRLKLWLAGFVAAYCLFNMVRLVRNRPEHTEGSERTGRSNLMISGASTGFVGGLLGLGGGVLLVPMLQMLCRVPLRQSIATSSAVICVTAVLGAALKILSLPGLSQPVGTALLLAGVMAPTAVVGGLLGAGLTHRLPIRGVRLVVTILLMAAATRLAGLWG